MTASPSGDRAISPVIGTITLVLLTVLLTAIIGTTVVGSTGLGPDSASSPVALSASADESGTISLTHDGGSAIDVEKISVRVTVDGEPLERQPPVPFFSARGFEPGPSGAFNSASDGPWSVGETTSFTVAGTNAPALTAGATVEVRVLRDERVLASAETSVEGRSGDANEG